MEKSSKFDLVKRQKNKTLEIFHQQNNVVISQEAIKPPHELNETLLILSYKVNWKLGYQVAESNGSRKEWKRAWFGNQGGIYLTISKLWGEESKPSSLARERARSRTRKAWAASWEASRPPMVETTSISAFLTTSGFVVSISSRPSLAAIDWKNEDRPI